jgi:AhpD family alkylhydroperoxidase
MNLKSSVIALAVAVTSFSSLAHAEGPRSPEATAAIADMEKTLGMTISWVRDQPDDAVAPMWEQLKGLQMNPKTALNGKSKELIGLGVAAQVPCKYCIYGHQEFAKVNGATSKELREALATAALARELSALTHGSEFKGSVEASPELASVHQEIAAAFGTEPDFFKRYPPAALTALWKQVKAVTLNANGALPVKLKALISLAVAAQMPSDVCVKNYTAMARNNGATEQEIQEAIAMAGLTRSASTMLNGLLTDENQFKHDVDAVVRHVTAPPGKKAAAR